MQQYGDGGQSRGFVDMICRVAEGALQTPISFIAARARMQRVGTPSVQYMTSFICSPSSV